MRLIDADALTQLHCEGCSEDVRAICKDDPVCASLMWVTEAPTIEAEPVRHGRWVASDPDDHGCVKHICSECGKYRLYMWSDYVNCDYCPNCGAKMDGGSHEV